MGWPHQPLEHVGDAFRPRTGGEGILEGRACCFELISEILCQRSGYEPTKSVSNNDASDASRGFPEGSEPTDPHG